MTATPAILLRDVPAESGCLSVLVHRGYWPAATEHGVVKFPCGKCVPIVGSAGTRDPDVWLHVMWFAGRAYSAELKCDCPGVRPSLECLHQHLLDHPEVWEPIAILHP